MDWTNLILNPKTIESFYSRAPSLLGVRILEIMLQENGPTICLRIDLNDFPDKIPKKWLFNGFNQAQIKIRFSGIIRLEISGWATDNIVDIVIEKISEGISLKAKGSRTRIEGICYFVDVEGVTGYVKGD